MKGFGKFWKLLGASTSKNREEAESAVSLSQKYDEWASSLKDDEFADAAHALDLLSDDAPAVSYTHLTLPTSDLV